MTTQIQREASSSEIPTIADHQFITAGSSIVIGASLLSAAIGNLLLGLGIGFLVLGGASFISAALVRHAAMTKR